MKKTSEMDPWTQGDYFWLTKERKRRWWGGLPNQEWKTKRNKEPRRCSEGRRSSPECKLCWELSFSLWATRSWESRWRSQQRWKRKQLWKWSRQRCESGKWWKHSGKSKIAKDPINPLLAENTWSYIRQVQEKTTHQMVSESFGLQRKKPRKPIQKRSSRMICCSPLGKGASFWVPCPCARWYSGPGPQWLAWKEKVI